MSNVTRYDPHFAWATGEYLEMQATKAGQYVLASDYDRDMQALEVQLELTRDLVTAAKDAKDDVVNDANITIKALQRRVDDLVTNLDLCKGNELAAQVDTLTGHLAACREALITSIYNRSPYVENMTGDLIADGLRDYMTEMEADVLIDKVLAQEGDGMVYQNGGLMIKPTQTQIDAVLNECVEQEQKGGSRWPGMSYEQGILATLEWVSGIRDISPLVDE